MNKFPIGSLVKHKESPVLVFRVIDELTSVPEGGPSLYECIQTDVRTYKYHEDDLALVAEWHEDD